MANEVQLIDAYTLAEEIESMTVTVAGKPARWNDAKHSVLRVIADQKDIDPETLRPKGRWIDRMVRDWVCSECGGLIQKVRKVDGYCYDDKPNYCPDCGADMREGKYENHT